MKKSTTSTPHDAVFKTFLRHPETARDFMEIHLPVSLRQLCDLLGLVERIASLLVTGCANDRQLKALFNYLMIQHGHTPRFTTFIRDVVGHVPHTKERLMTLIERIQRIAEKGNGKEDRLVWRKGWKKGWKKVSALPHCVSPNRCWRTDLTARLSSGSPALRLKSFRMLATNAVPV